MSNGHRSQAIFMRRVVYPLSLLVLLLSFSVSAQTYQIIDLGPAGSAESSGQSISNSNRAVGWFSTASESRQAFSACEGCAPQELGFLPGGSESVATAISDNGLYVVGYGGINAYGPNFSEIRQGFIHTSQGMQTLGELYCPCSFNVRYGRSEAHGVNDSGQVVGFAQTQRADATHAFLWQNGVMQDIGGGAGDASISRAFDINNASQIVGDFAQDAALLNATEGFDRQAVIWQSTVRQSLGTLPGHSSSSARAINENGVVAGWSGTPNATVSNAVIWSNGSIQNLGTLPGEQNSRALGINDAGQVVGWSGTRAFVWQNGSMRDLNTLLADAAGWQILLEATDINNQGVITGIGLRGGATHAFMLRPATPPEPPPPPPPPPPAVGAWPAPYNGITPSPSLNLGFNNIGVLNPADQQIYTCVRIHSNGAPATLDGLSRIGIALEIMSMEAGIVRVTRSRPFNPMNARNEFGELPTCSGVFDNASGRYVDVISYAGQILRVSFEMLNAASLELRLLEIVEIG